MSGTFTFTLTEREATVLLDALEHAVAEPPTESVFTREDFAESAAVLAERLAW